MSNVNPWLQIRGSEALQINLFSTKPYVVGTHWSLVNPFLLYTNFNTLKKKPYENIVKKKKGEIAQNEHYHLFPQCFLCNLYLEILY